MRYRLHLRFCFIYVDRLTCCLFRYSIALSKPGHPHQKNTWTHAYVPEPTSPLGKPTGYGASVFNALLVEVAGIEPASRTPFSSLHTAILLVDLSANQFCSLPLFFLICLLESCFNFFFHLRDRFCTISLLFMYNYTYLSIAIQILFILLYSLLSLRKSPIQSSRFSMNISGSSLSTPIIITIRSTGIPVLSSKATAYADVCIK